MIVLSSVVLPVPLRPRTASDSPSLRLRSILEMTRASPEPPETCRNARILCIEALAEIDLPHPWVGGYLLHAAFGQQRAVHENRDATGEAEHQVHVMLDEQQRDLKRKRRHSGEALVTFGLGHAGRRFIEQEDARSARECQRDLE